MLPDKKDIEFTEKNREGSIMRPLIVSKEEQEYNPLIKGICEAFKNGSTIYFNQVVLQIRKQRDILYSIDCSNKINPLGHTALHTCYILFTEAAEKEVNDNQVADKKSILNTILISLNNTLEITKQLIYLGLDHTKVNSEGRTALQLILERSQNKEYGDIFTKAIITGIKDKMKIDLTKSLPHDFVLPISLDTDKDKGCCRTM